MSTRVNADLITCAPQEVRKKVAEYLQALAEDGIEIPNSVDGMPIDKMWCSADTELMQMLCAAFPDTLFLVDYDTPEQYSVYWHNGKEYGGDNCRIAPDFQKLGITDTGSIELEHLSNTMVVKAGADYLTAILHSEEDNGPAMGICRNGKELVQVGFNKQHGCLEIHFADTDMPPYDGDLYPVHDEGLLLSSEQITVLRALSDLDATHIFLHGNKIKAYFEDQDFIMETPYKAPLFPAFVEGAQYRIAELLQLHSRTRYTTNYVVDDSCPRIKVSGDTVFSGSETPAGVLSVHFSSDEDSPSISIRCLNEEVARVEYSPDKNTLQTIVSSNSAGPICMAFSPQ